MAYQLRFCSLGKSEALLDVMEGRKELIPLDERWTEANGMFVT